MVFDVDIHAHQFRRWLYRIVHLRFSETTRLLWLCVGIGIFTALSVALYHVAIDAAFNLFRGWLPAGIAGGILGIGTLALAGVIAGLIHQRHVGHERHHGVAGVIEAVALDGGRLPYWKMPFKALNSAIALGAGAAAGPEDPSVQIGSNLGSLAGQRFRLSEEQVRLLVAAGAASAVAAAFNAPIAGVFFALEIVLNGVFTTGAFGAIVLAAVVSSAMTQAIHPHNPDAIGPLTYTLTTPAEIVLYVPLGILMAPLAAGYVKLVYWNHDLWHNFLPRPLRMAMAGALVGVIGLFLPQILGIGRETMNGILSGELSYPLLLLLALAFGKMIANSITLAGGFVGGIFAPALFIGTMFGAAYGQAVSFLGVSPQAFAIAGMAAMLGGVLRAPIMAIMLVFELTGDYRLILPVMLTTVLCIYFAERVQKEGVYAFSLVRAGIRLRQGRDVDLMQSVLVQEAMHTPAPTIRETAVLPELRQAFQSAGTRSLCVVDETGSLYGIVTLRDLQRAYETRTGEHHENVDKLTVGDICIREVITAGPSENVWEAIRRMGHYEIGRLPVVEPETRRLLGIVRRHNIIQAYNFAIARRLEDQHRAEQIRLNTLTGAHVMEMRIEPGASIAGKTIGSLNLPHECIIAAVWRNNKLVVPHGDTKLYAKDRLAIVAEPEAEPELQELVRKRE